LYLQLIRLNALVAEESQNSLVFCLLGLSSSFDCFERQFSLFDGVAADAPKLGPLVRSAADRDDKNRDVEHNIEDDDRDDAPADLPSAFFVS